MGIFVGPTLFPPEPGELQAMDAYPVMVDVQFRTHKPLQAEEARLAFEAIVAELPDVPALLLHNAEWLVASYLPGEPIHYFEASVTPDPEDLDIWGARVLRVE
jgi:aminoglycoside phosphotransferase